MTVQVVTQLLRDASTAAADLAGQVGALQLAAGAESAVEALPESAAATAGAGLAGTWRTGVSTLARDVDAYALALSGAADDYDHAEQGTTAAMDGLGR